MADDRNLAGLDVLAVIGHGLGRPGIDARCQSRAPGLNPRIGGDVKLVGGDLRPARCAGVKPPGVRRLVVVDPRREILLVLARWLVAVGHEQERGVVAVSREDAIGLLVQPAVDRLAQTERRTGVGPRGAFDVKVEPQLIGRLEGRLGRTPGVETEQVQAVVLGDPDDSPPGFQVGRRQPGPREDRAFQRAANKELTAVQPELRARRGDLAEAERRGARSRRLVVDRGGHAVERWAKLVPERGDALELDFLAERSPLLRPRHQAHLRAQAAHLAGECDASSSTPCPAFPVVLPIRPRTVADLLAKVGKHLKIGDPDRRRRDQGEPAGDPVPVSLGVVGHAVRVDADVHDQTVIDADRQQMFARGDVRAKLVLVGRRQAVARAQRAAVEPGAGLDVGPLQGEDQAAALPIGRESRPRAGTRQRRHSASRAGARRAP